ncbi:MAG: presenilin family intramembrane aspartyl protease [Nanoarchaeota archaeon]
MKHNWNVTLLIVVMFFVAQLIGLYITNEYVGEELPLGIERPELDPETSYVPVFLIILVATALAFVIAFFKAVRLWKFWFFLSVFFVLGIALGAFFNEYIAFGISLIVAFYKIIRPNVWIHNISELFLYGGLGAMFVPLFNIWSVSILLILIMGYDAIAVWKTKHMVKLAKFQSKMKFFTGFLIPYGKNRVAILGGGDIGFTLLFSGVVFVKYGLISLIVPLIASLGLLGLLVYGDKNKFYPAMPFIGVSCFIGYGIVYLLA